MKTNYLVQVIEGDYPEGSGTATLLGIYSTKEAAEIIKNIQKSKTNGEIVIEETEFPVTTTKM